MDLFSKEPWEGSDECPCDPGDPSPAISEILVSNSLRPPGFPPPQLNLPTMSFPLSYDLKEYISGGHSKLLDMGITVQMKFKYLYAGKW